MTDLLLRGSFRSFDRAVRHWRIEMYAIIRTGGKQYRVEAGKTVRVEKLDPRN